MKAEIAQVLEKERTEMPEPELHIYCDGCEWVIATSKRDATLVYIQTTGETPDDPHLDDEERWDQLSDDETTKMWCDDAGQVCEIGEGALTELTNREWCQRRGRGYLGGTEG